MRRKDRKEWQEDIEALNEAEEKAIDLLADLLEVSISDAKQYVEEYRYGGVPAHERKAADAMASLFKNLKQSRLKPVIDSIDQLSGYLDNFMQQPAAKGVIEGDFSYDTIEKFLTDRGEKAYDEVGVPSNVYWILTEVTCGAARRFEYHRKAPYGLIKNIAQRVATLSETNSVIARLYCEDFLNSVKKAYFSLSAIRTPRVILKTILQDIYPALERIERMESGISDYSKLNEFKDQKAAIGIVNRRTNEGTLRWDVIRELIPELFDIEQRGISLRAVSPLFMDGNKPIEGDELKDLFEFMKQNPEFMRAYCAVSKQAVVPYFRGFILSYSQLPLKTDCGYRTSGDVIGYLLKQRKTKVMNVLIEQEAEWILDDRLEDIVKTAFGFRLADLVLADYFQYRSTGEPKKQEIMLAIGGYRNIGDQWLKEARAAIRNVNEDSIQDINPYEMRPRQLMAALTKANKVELKKAVQPSEKRKWIDVIYTKASDSVNVREAYGVLSDLGLTHKLRYVWKNQPESVSLFCQHVKALETDFLRPLLTDPTLFPLYLERVLRDSHFTESLYEAASKEGNEYSILNNLLIPGYAYPIRGIPEGVSESIMPRIENSAFSRVIIIGGQFSSAAKSRIINGCPLPMEIYDYSVQHKQTPDSVQSTDLVIAVSKSNAHPSYWAVKKHCKTHGIAFFHTERSGLKAVTDFVNETLTSFGQN